MKTSSRSHAVFTLESRLPTAWFVKGWAGSGFKADPPNIAVTLHEPNGSTDTIVAVMRKPTFKDGILRATLQVLSGEQAQTLTGSLANHGKNHDPVGIPTALGAVSLFIDDVVTGGTYVYDSSNGSTTWQPTYGCTGGSWVYNNSAGSTTWQNAYPVWNTSTYSYSYTS